ncbi:MAG: UbiX family flavin prenyltransferase [Acidilobaceae archaeon]
MTVALTGASGIRVALRLLQHLSSLNIEIYGIIVTKTAKTVAEVEEGLMEDELMRILKSYARVYENEDYDSPLASSSNQSDAMVIVPASMKTIGFIVNGIPEGLVSRAALAVLRLRRKLVVAPRESPLGVSELRNLYKLALSGAIVVPITLAFYNLPKTIDDVIDFNVGKILDVLGIEHNVYKRWEGLTRFKTPSPKPHGG